MTRGDLRRGTGRTVLVGLIGRGIGPSRTPRMHEVEGARLGLRYVYRRLDLDLISDPVPSLADLLRAAELCGFAGVNVTHPFKRDAVALVDEVSAPARAIGAINTVVFQAGRRIGHNTDVLGFAESFRREMAEMPRDTVLLLGAGGAGAAVASALLEIGVTRLLIADAQPARARDLSAQLSAGARAAEVEAIADPLMVLGAVDGVVNATPIGMADHPGTPIPTGALAVRHWVVDIVYFPLETAFLAAARAAGCRVLSGAGMAVHQAAGAFELFTGVAADAERMRATFDGFDAE